MKFKKLLTIPVLLIGLLIVFQLSRSIVSMYRRGGRVEELAAEVAGLEEQKRELEEDKEFRQTSGFVEREARDKLRMVREGERILVLPDEGQNEESSKFNLPAGKAGVQSSKNEEEIEPNWQRWIDYWLR